MNFRTGRADLAGNLRAGSTPTRSRRDAPAIYLSSIDVKDYFDGLHEANHVDLGTREPIESIWIGTRTRIAAHNDFPHNLACCAVGRRRFTLFPPDQFANLYVGPLDNTPAGRPVSMVDLREPDFDKYPRFREALASAQVAELGPGRRDLHPVDVVAPCRGARAVQRAGELLVARHAAFPRPAAGCAQPRLAGDPRLARRTKSELWRQMFEYYVFGDPAAAAARISRRERAASSTRSTPRAPDESAPTCCGACRDERLAVPQNRHRRRRHRGLDGGRRDRPDAGQGGRPDADRIRADRDHRRRRKHHPAAGHLQPAARDQRSRFHARHPGDVQARHRVRELEGGRPPLFPQLRYRPARTIGARASSISG